MPIPIHAVLSVAAERTAPAGIGIVLDPAIGALATSASTVIVSLNVMQLRRIKLT